MKIQTIELSYSDKLEKIGAMNLTLAFSIATKRHLRSEFGIEYPELKHLLTHVPKFKEPKNNEDINNLPLDIFCELSNFIQRCRGRERIDIPTYSAMLLTLSGMVSVLSDFERIRDTPIPKAYSIHLKQTLLLYLATLPFQLVSLMGWSTV